MNDKDYDSIDELDAALEAEFSEKLAQAETEEEEEIAVEDEEIQETETEEENEEIDAADQELDELPKEQNKSNKAFAEMRIANKEAKKRIAELEAQITQKSEKTEAEKTLEKLALKQGFDSVEAFQSALAQQELEAQAKQQGIDPKLLERINKLEQHNQQLQQEKLQSQREVQAQRVLSQISDIENELGVSQEEIVTALAEQGFNEDILLNMPDVRPILRGMFVDKIVEARNQKQLAKQKQKELLADESHNSGNDSLSIDELEDQQIAAELAAYEKDFL